MLKVEGLNVYYGAIHALHDVSFEVKKGEIVTLIGANGAGKTTILHTVSGLVRAKSGKVSFLDKDITTAEAHNILKMGLAHVPEGRRVFSQMSVQENLMMGAYARKDKAGIAEGTPDEIRNNPEVITAYLGKNNPVNEGVGGATC